MSITIPDWNHGSLSRQLRGSMDKHCVAEPWYGYRRSHRVARLFALGFSIDSCYEMAERRIGQGFDR